MMIPPDLLAKIRPYTLLSPPKVEFMYKQALASEGIPGNVAEVGVFRGGCTKLLALCLPDKQVFAFDTFDGLPKDDKYHKKGAFRESFEVVRDYLAECGNVSIYKGIFPDTAGAIEDEKFCLVHLDVDLYEYTLLGLEFFYSRMTPGGIFMLDDYDFPHTPGVTLAIDEFFADKTEEVVISVPKQQAFVKKD